MVPNFYVNKNINEVIILILFPFNIKIFDIIFFSLPPFKLSSGFVDLI